MKTKFNSKHKIKFEFETMEQNMRNIENNKYEDDIVCNVYLLKHKTFIVDDLMDYKSISTYCITHFMISFFISLIKCQL